jgi:PAS domain S-box-containing protein
MANELLGVANAAGYLIAFNPAFQASVGWSTEELISRPILEFIHEDDRATTERKLTEAESSGQSVTLESRWITADGGWRRMRWQARHEGSVWFFVALDVTEQRETEEERQILSAIVEGSEDAITATKLDGRVTSWNRGAERLYGYSAAEAIGATLDELIIPADRDGERAQIVERLREGKDVRRFETVRRRKDGTTVPISLTAAPIHDEVGRLTGISAIARDMTEQRHKESLLQEELDMMAWVGRLKDALAHNRLVMYAQPIVPLRSGLNDTCELLVRMTTTEGEIVPPGSFLPAAERWGLIQDLDRWVIKQAAELASTGHRLQINLSGHSVANPNLTDVIAHDLVEANADPGLLTIEVTETALIEDLPAAQRFADGLADLGCGLALDDFGTGFGGFTYLKNFHVDYLKIDAEFVGDLLTSTASQNLVKAVVGLAENFGVQTIAEGVEAEETLELLRDYDVDFAQGFFLGRPGPLSEQAKQNGKSTAGRPRRGSPRGSAQRLSMQRAATR